MCICYLFTTVTSLPCIMHPMRNLKKDSEYTNCLFESHALDNYPHFALEMPASIFVSKSQPFNISYYSAKSVLGYLKALQPKRN